MRLKLTALFTILALSVSSCGGGGSDDSVFKFLGVWFSTLRLASNTCNLNSADEGQLSFDVNQGGDIVDAAVSSFTWTGRAGSDNFTGLNVIRSPFLCSDLSEATNLTSELSFTGASGNSTSVQLTFFQNCPDFEEQCELTYTGSAIRVSGGGSSSGETEVQVNSVVTNPLF